MTILKRYCFGNTFKQKLKRKLKQYFKRKLEQKFVQLNRHPGAAGEQVQGDTGGLALLFADCF